jgi:hypothetical protein
MITDLDVSGYVSKWISAKLAFWGRADLDQRPRWSSVPFGCSGPNDKRTGELSDWLQKITYPQNGGDEKRWLVASFLDTRSQLFP